MTVNPLRGEVSISLEGVEYGMRPTFEAVTEIEEQTGLSTMQLSNDSGRGRLSLNLQAIVITACIKAWGAEQNPPRTDTPHFLAENVARLIHAEGILKAQPRVDLLLTQALTGGYIPGEALAAGTTKKTRTPRKKSATPAAD